MKNKTIVSLCLLASSLLATQAMLVKNWGTDSYARRLAWSTRLLIEDSEKFLELGMPQGMVSVLGFTSNFTVKNPLDLDVTNADRYLGSFKAFNSWFDDFYVNHTMLHQKHGKLRRFILNRAERLVHEKDSGAAHLHSGKSHQHELITCDECVSLEASRFQYGYTTWVKDLNLQSWGMATYEGPIRYALTFQISLSVEYNKATDQNDCISKLEEFKLRKEDGPLRMETLDGDGSFAFLADYMDDWTLNHLNTTVAEDFQAGLRSWMQFVMIQRQMCKDFLTSGIFSNVE